MAGDLAEEDSATAGELQEEDSAAAALEEEALVAASRAVALPAVVLPIVLPPPGSLVATLRATRLPTVALAAAIFDTALVVGTSAGAFSAGRHLASVWASDTADTAITTTRATRGPPTATHGLAVTTTDIEANTRTVAGQPHCERRIRRGAPLTSGASPGLSGGLRTSLKLIPEAGSAPVFPMGRGPWGCCSVRIPEQ